MSKEANEISVILDANPTSIQVVERPPKIRTRRIPYVDCNNGESEVISVFGFQSTYCSVCFTIRQIDIYCFNN